MLTLFYRQCQNSRTITKPRELGMRYKNEPNFILPLHLFLVCLRLLFSVKVFAIQNILAGLSWCGYSAHNSLSRTPPRRCFVDHKAGGELGGALWDTIWHHCLPLQCCADQGSTEAQSIAQTRGLVKFPNPKFCRVPKMWSQNAATLTRV